MQLLQICWEIIPTTMILCNLPRSPHCAEPSIKRPLILPSIIRDGLTLAISSLMELLHTTSPLTVTPLIELLGLRKSRALRDKVATVAVLKVRVAFGLSVLLNIGEPAQEKKMQNLKSNSRVDISHTLYLRVAIICRSMYVY